ncbi:MAG: 4Fe-4S dicluster domain-containing protein [Zestosphaera sp.]
MSVSGLYVGHTKGIEMIFNELKRLDYVVVGYKVEEDVLKLRELNSFEELASGVEDVQNPGRYYLARGKFSRHGPDSLKRFFYPPTLTLFSISPKWDMSMPDYVNRKIAFLGIKPCDLVALKVLDRVLLNVDEYYTRLRRNTALIIENCTAPGNTCFCATMSTGPRARDSFDLAYTRLDSRLVLEAGSDLGLRLLSLLEVEPIDDSTYRDFETVMRKASEKARAGFELSELPELLELNIGSKAFKEVAGKCLGCANCNMVCPTCFCFDVLDVPKIDGFADRVRVWDGCLNFTYAQVAGGHFRSDLWARYRHFVLHKFTYWIKQFGTYGCVGCGRCITWCPTGIDLRESVKKVLRGDVDE